MQKTTVGHYDSVEGFEICWEKNLVCNWLIKNQSKTWPRGRWRWPYVWLRFWCGSEIWGVGRALILEKKSAELKLMRKHGPQSPGTQTHPDLQHAEPHEDSRKNKTKRTKRREQKMKKQRKRNQNGWNIEAKDGNGRVGHAALAVKRYCDFKRIKRWKNLARQKPLSTKKAWSHARSICPGKRQRIENVLVEKD